MNECQETTKRGNPCNAPARPGSAYCTFHDPAMAANRAAGRSRGGHARHGRQIGPTGQTAIIVSDSPTVQDIADALWAEFVTVSQMEKSLSRARTMAYLAEKLLKLAEVGEMSERLAALERLMNEQH